MKRVIIILLIFPELMLAQAPGCPNIDVPDETVSCNMPCVDLIATYLETGETTSYDVSSIAYAPPYAFTGGTSAFLGTDDIFSDVITIPFNFCFYGNTYNQLLVGANGLISFDLSLANLTCNWSYTASIPSTPTLTGPYENAIHGAYLDIDPSVGGDINYTTLGTAPCRTFVVNFNNVPSFSCNNLLVTQQIVIYETTNAIEVYIQDKPTCTTWNSGNAVIGIQNIGATQGICPPLRNTGPWTTTNEAWRFTPNGTPNYVVEWFDISGNSLGFGDTLNVCTQTQDNYTAEISYTNCNGAIVTESTTNTVFINSAAGQIASLGLVDTIKSCTNPVIITPDNTLDTYLWSTGDTTSSITIYQTGNYILEATQGGCNGDDTVYVSIVNANILENNTTICELETIDLNIEESNTIVNWSTTETTDNIMVTPLIDTEYWVEISDGVTICKDSIQINIHQQPIVNLGNDTIIPCRTSITITPSISNGSIPYNFLWNDGSIGDNITVEEGNISVTIIDGNGCTDHDSVSIMQNIAPTAIISGGGRICENETTTINFNFNGLIPWNLTYSKGSINTTINNINSINYSISTSIAGTYNIILAEDINSCNADIDGDDYVIIIVDPLPNPIISPGFYEIYQGEEVILTAGEYAYYEWYTDADYLISENEFIVVDSSLTTYIVVTTDQGCIGESSNAIVSSIPRVELYIPNTFTPNGDEHNDLLVTIGNKIDIFNMIITNRWGDIVYTTNNINKYWDGKWKGIAVPQGVYSYKVNLIGEDKRKFNTTGQVQLIY